MAYTELCKIRIAVLSAFSAATGFMLFPAALRSQIIILVSGVFLMACGSSALNQYQERVIDAVMPRTCGRPLPSGRIRPADALYFSLWLVFSGFLVILFTGSMTAALLGLSAVLWYNGLYTHLKKITAFAVIPGALVGAIPPAIGWIAAGGGMIDPRLLFICFFFFIWQVPHFWLLIMTYGTEYEKAGVPSLTGILSEMQLRRIIFVWMSATAVSCLILSASGVVRGMIVNITLLLLSSWLIWVGLKPMLLQSAGPLALSSFRKINMYLFMVMVFLAVDKIFVLA